MLRKAVNDVARRRTFSTLPQHADIVVVGGGVIGVATAMEAAQRLGKSGTVVLLEQNGLTTGTTWHAAGLMAGLKGSRALACLARHTQNMYKQWDNIGWYNTGSLAIARNNDSWEQLLHSYQTVRALDINSEIITKEQIKQIHPFLETDGLVGGGIFSPSDGIVNPGDVTQHMARIAKSNGAHIFEHTRFLSAKREGRKITSITTDKGDITCGNILIAGGMWTKDAVRELYQREFDPIVLAGCPHQYTIFERIEGVSNKLPVVRDGDNKFYLKPEVGGLMVGVFEGDGLETLTESVVERNRTGIVPPDIQNEIFAEDIDKAGTWFENCLEVVPVLQETGIKSWLHGPDSHSGDHAFNLGRLWHLDNGYVACGFNSQGIQTGAGTGLAMVEWMLDDYPHSFDCDFSSCDIQRYNPTLGSNLEHCHFRCSEGYGKLYQVHYPREVFEASRGHRFSPLHSRLAEKGAVFGEAYGWERALYFSDAPQKPNNHFPSIWAERGASDIPLKVPLTYSFRANETEFFEAEKLECTTARTDAVVFDLSAFGKIKVSGPDAEKALQFACTADVGKESGSVTYSLVCHKNGGIAGDLTVCRISENEYYVVTVSFQPDLIKDHLEKVFEEHNFKNVSIEDVTTNYGVVSIMGPKSKDVLKTIVDDANLLNDDVQPPFTCFEVTVGGVKCTALRISFIGELGWELHCPVERTCELYDNIFIAAENMKVPLRDAGSWALVESLRVEKMFVHYGHDVTPAENPLDAGLGFACKLKSDVDFVHVYNLSKELTTRYHIPRESGHFKKLCWRILASNTYPLRKPNIVH